MVLDVVLGPEACGGGRLDRDAAFLFFLEEVHGGGAFVHFADLVAASGVVQNALGHGGFARVNVGANADVADFAQIECHGCDPWE